MNASDTDGMRRLEEEIGYAFTDRTLLLRARTRLAYALEPCLPPAAHMDALATLGDAGINVVCVVSVVAVCAHDKGAITNR